MQGGRTGWTCGCRSFRCLGKCENFFFIFLLIWDNVKAEIRMGKGKREER